MSHTFTHYSDPKQPGELSRHVVFNFDGDFTGDVLIRVDAHEELNVPFDAIKAFVGECVRRQKICEMENASLNQILGLQ